MKLSEDYNAGAYMINGYDAEGIIINQRSYTSSLIVSNHQLVENWPLQNILELTTENLAPILQLKPEVILIGTGASLIFPPPSSYANVIQLGLGIEFMDSIAACRTYNILFSEDRSVVAGIIL
ncbi:MAG: Mth938-like domain-containing protein [Gammaproteobacteria bacterium]